jgi:hypothetical protein
MHLASSWANATNHYDSTETIACNYIALAYYSSLNTYSTVSYSIVLHYSVAIYMYSAACKNIQRTYRAYMYYHYTILQHTVYTSM